MYYERIRCHYDHHLMPLQNAATPFHLFQNNFILRRCNISTAEGEASGSDRKVGTGVQAWQVKHYIIKRSFRFKHIPLPLTLMVVLASVLKIHILRDGFPTSVQKHSDGRGGYVPSLIPRLLLPCAILVDWFIVKLTVLCICLLNV